MSMKIPETCSQQEIDIVMGYGSLLPLRCEELLQVVPTNAFCTGILLNAFLMPVGNPREMRTSPGSFKPPRD